MWASCNEILALRQAAFPCASPCAVFLDGSFLISTSARLQHTKVLWVNCEVYSISRIIRSRLIGIGMIYRNTVRSKYVKYTVCIRYPVQNDFMKGFNNLSSYENDLIQFFTANQQQNLLYSAAIKLGF